MTLKLYFAGVYYYRLGEDHPVTYSLIGYLMGDNHLENRRPADVYHLVAEEDVLKARDRVMRREQERWDAGEYLLIQDRNRVQVTVDEVQMPAAAGHLDVVANHLYEGEWSTEDGRWKFA